MKLPSLSKNTESDTESLETLPTQSNHEDSAENNIPRSKKTEKTRGVGTGVHKSKRIKIRLVVISLLLNK